jgi:hypothetical protein
LGADSGSSAEGEAGALELSVVMPCLDEADTVGDCVEKALRAMSEHVIVGEVVVADNGSSDDSPAYRAPRRRPRRTRGRTRLRQRLYSPRGLFLVPGLLLVALGVVGYALALPGISLGGLHFDAHTLLVASLAILLGYQSILFAILSKTFAVTTGLVPDDGRVERFFEIVNLERGLAIGTVSLLTGIGLLVAAFLQWRDVGFGDLDYARTMRWVIPGVTLAALGFQTILNGWFVSILGMGRRSG